MSYLNPTTEELNTIKLAARKAGVKNKIELIKWGQESSEFSEDGEDVPNFAYLFNHNIKKGKNILDALADNSNNSLCFCGLEDGIISFNSPTCSEEVLNYIVASDVFINCNTFKPVYYTFDAVNMLSVKFNIKNSIKDIKELFNIIFPFLSAVAVADTTLDFRGSIKCKIHPIELQEYYDDLGIPIIYDTYLAPTIVIDESVVDLSKTKYGYDLNPDELLETVKLEYR